MLRIMKKVDAVVMGKLMLLVLSMHTNLLLSIYTNNQVYNRVQVNQIQREDGSGKSYNLSIVYKMLPDGEWEYATIHVWLDKAVVEEFVGA